MGKRSDFARIERDYYKTPAAAMAPLFSHLPHVFSYAEPCAGDGRMITHITKALPEATCVFAADIEPQAPGIRAGDALDLSPETFSDTAYPDYIITNPPWARSAKSGFLLHRMIETFVRIAPTWLIFDADWMHTVQARPLIEQHLRAIVSVGRVKWIEGSTMTGKDNCCWYLFDRAGAEIPTFHGRNILPVRSPEPGEGCRAA